MQYRVLIRTTFEVGSDQYEAGKEYVVSQASVKHPRFRGRYTVIELIKPEETVPEVVSSSNKNGPNKNGPKKKGEE